MLFETLLIFKTPNNDLGIQNIIKYITSGQCSYIGLNEKELSILSTQTIISSTLNKKYTSSNRAKRLRNKSITSKGKKQIMKLVGVEI